MSMCALYRRAESDGWAVRCDRLRDLFRLVRLSHDVTESGNRCPLFRPLSVGLNSHITSCWKCRHWPWFGGDLSFVAFLDKERRRDLFSLLFLRAGGSDGAIRCRSPGTGSFFMILIFAQALEILWRKDADVMWVCCRLFPFPSSSRAPCVPARVPVSACASHPTRPTRRRLRAARDLPRDDAGSRPHVLFGLREEVRAGAVRPTFVCHGGRRAAARANAKAFRDKFGLELLEATAAPRWRDCRRQRAERSDRGERQYRVQPGTVGHPPRACPR